MKRLMQVLFMVSVFLMVVTSAAMADTIPMAGEYMTLESYNTTPTITGEFGGLMNFYVSTTTGSGTANFSTFCIQNNVYINQNQLTYVQQLSDMVGFSGVGMGSSGAQGATGNVIYTPVALNSDTAYVYSRFATGAYGTLGASDQANLQQLLWDLQNGKFTAPTKPGDPSIATQIINALGASTWESDAATMFSTATGYYGVEVANLVECNSAGTVIDAPGTLYDEQNMLVYVPEPATLLLLGFGISALAVARRRK